MKQNLTLGQILDISKNEIGNLVQGIMEKNHIPPDLMLYVLDSISNDIARTKNLSDSQRYAGLVDLINISKNKESEENENS